MLNTTTKQAAILNPNYPNVYYIDKQQQGQNLFPHYEIEPILSPE